MQEVTINLKDDLNGGDAVETFAYTFDGVSYEIDLGEANAARFRKAISKYVDSSRRISPKTRTSRRRAPDMATVRAWALEHDIAVNSRGRVPDAIIERFLAARA